MRIKLFGIVEESLSENTENIFYIGLGKSFGNVIIDEALKNVSIDNYLFFSLTEFNYASDSKIIGIGFLGKVYISEKVNKEMFNETKK